MRPLPKYLPDDQRKHLGDPPWREGVVLDAWIAAHNHDPRTKCLVEYGCQALDDHYEWLLEAYEREREAYTELADAYMERGAEEARRLRIVVDGMEVHADYRSKN